MPLRILANENIPGPVVALLRQVRHEVASVKETMRGAADDVILATARAERRLVITCDKDFGELAFRAGLAAPCGIVLFRLGGTSPEQDNRRMVAALTGRDDWVGRFSVVTEDRVRMRLLPHG